jgi:hypothetical protein
MAASDGYTMSNTFALYQANCSGLAVEYDGEKFKALSGLYRRFNNVNLLRAKITPENVLDILRCCSTPENFTFLNMDIDSYDYFVLREVLTGYRPSLICAEVNEKIPPPIRFSVKYDPSHVWASDHFYGQSLAQLALLCEDFRYDLVELHYNNAFLVPREINSHAALAVQDAYDQGYRLKPDRRKLFPWNADMDLLLSMTTPDALRFLNEKFKKYEGRYVIE